MEGTPEQADAAAAARAARDAEIMREIDAWLSAPVLEATEPDDSVRFVFELIHMARALEYHLLQVAKRHQMTAMQARFAWIMAASPWPVPQQNIQVALGMSQGGVSRMVQRMRDRGLVECDLSTFDMRYATVTLTKRGKKQWTRLRDELASVCGELSEAVGTANETTFRARASSVLHLDERHGYFEALRNPRPLLS